MYIDANDPKYKYKHFYVYLNGKEQKQVVKANEEEGWIEIIDEQEMEKQAFLAGRRSGKGYFAVPDVLTKRLKGIVTIVEHK